MVSQVSRSWKALLHLSVHNNDWSGFALTLDFGVCLLRPTQPAKVLGGIETIETQRRAADRRTASQLCRVARPELTTDVNIRDIAAPPRLALVSGPEC